MLKAIWSFLYEYFIGKDVRFKTAIKEHKKKLVFLIVTFASIFFDYLLGKQVLNYQKADAICINKLKSSYDEINKLNHEIDQLRETNLVLAKKLGTEEFNIDNIKEKNNISSKRKVK